MRKYTMISVLPETRQRLQDLKNSRGVPYDALIAEFLIMYGSPSTSETIRPYTHADK